MSVLSLLDSFKIACDSNRIYEGAAMCLFAHSFWKAAEAVLQHSLTAENRERSQQEDKLTTFCEVVHYL